MAWKMALCSLSTGITFVCQSQPLASLDHRMAAQQAGRSADGVETDVIILGCEGFQQLLFAKIDLSIGSQAADFVL